MLEVYFVRTKTELKCGNLAGLFADSAFRLVYNLWYCEGNAYTYL